jgi:DNA adenine methylase
MNRHKTPLRYPGGKQKLAPFIAEVMASNDLIGGHYAEPYAGGAGIAIELLLNGTATKIHLNDSSVPVYAFWRSILRKTDEFCRRISGASLTVAEWRRQQQILTRVREFGQLDVGFSLFYLNRCNRSGILSGGLIGGLKQAGNWKMDARFPRNELISRIEAIAARKESIALTNLDAEEFILQCIPKFPANTLIYCDPPYYHKANRLYLNHYQPQDHARVAGVIQRQIKHPWLVSYDSAPEIQEYYSGRRSFLYALQYNAAQAYKGRETFFFSDSLNLPTTSAIPSIAAALQEIRPPRPSAKRLRTG